MRMKWLLFGLTAMVFSGRAQVYQTGVIPVEKRWEYSYGNKRNVEVYDDTYFKDVNQVFDKYEGTWVGSINDKTIEINIDKFTDYQYRGIKEDRLLLRYKITGQGGHELINSLNLPKDDPLTAKGDVLLKAGNPLEQYHFIYFGEDSECGQEGDLVIRPTDNENQIELILSPDGDLVDYSDCPNGEAVNQLFPTNDWMIMTKQ